MHTPFDDGIFFWFVSSSSPFVPFLPLFLLQAKKKKEKNLRKREGKMWDLASPKSLSLQTVSRLLFFFVGSKEYLTRALSLFCTHFSSIP